jgi:two-component system alkaline phosphatase synthesis response regulator PhoP
MGTDLDKKILVVDDEDSILTLLQYNLESQGYSVTTAMNGEDALKLAKSEKFACIVLDLMLPKKDGTEVCKELRQLKINIPILMLTAKGDELDKILGLELGADDYMTKPFSPREVSARVKALIRRTMFNAEVSEGMDDNEFIEVGELRLYPEKYETIFKGKHLEFTPKEFELLMYIVKNKGRVLSRDQLLSAVWNYDFAGDTRIVDVHISHLREKIEEDTRKPNYIKTVRGLGYKFEEPK